MTRSRNRMLRSLSLSPGHSSLTHAFGDTLALHHIHGVIAFETGAQTLDGELRIDREAGFDFPLGLVQPAQMRETCRRVEMGPGIVSICVERFAQPRQSFPVPAETGLCKAHVKVPKIGGRITRAQAKGFQNVSLGLLRPADKCMGEPHVAVRYSKIRVECQRLL